MRKVLWGLACIAGLAACADGTGQVADPRYQFAGERPYDQYRAAREMALTGKAEVPQVVPKATPFEAPKPEDIASPTAVQRMQQQFRRAAPGAARQGGGGYVDPDTGRRLASNPAPARPAAAPARTAETDALTRYAQAQRHAPGTAAYPRAGGSAADAARACARFPNPDAAQLMFLSAGGPDQDTMGMDPDGDGFVCGWTQASRRAAGL